MLHRRMQKAKFGTFGKSKLWKFECVQNSVVLSQADLVSMKDMERFHENTLLDQILIFLLAKFIIGAKLTCWKLFHGNGNSAGTFFKILSWCKNYDFKKFTSKRIFMISRKKATSGRIAAWQSSLLRAPASASESARCTWWGRGWRSALEYLFNHICVQLWNIWNIYSIIFVCSFGIFEIFI